LRDLSSFAAAGGAGAATAGAAVEEEAPAVAEAQPELALDEPLVEEASETAVIEEEPVTDAETKAEAEAAAEAEPAAEAAPLADEEEPEEMEEGDDTEGARLIALNMALNGTPREETDKYLAENFEIPNRGRLLDEVYASVEG
jgi:hypothetical protein